MDTPAEQNTVLVVDDDPASLELLTDILSEDKVLVLPVISGESALTAVAENKPCLILLDVNLPGMNGFEVCSKLKENEIYRDTPIIFVSGMQNHQDKVKGFSLGGVDFITKPFQSDELLARVRTHLELNRLRTDLEAEVASRTDELLGSFERMRKVLGAIIHAMAVAVETRDPYTAGHQRRASDLARTIASEMNLEQDVADGLRMAAAIHDIGKISVPAEILSKPTKLTDIEFSLIKTHAQAGFDILKDIDFPWPIARTVLEHHERIDGSGYPRGLAGNELLLESKILAVADVVESMASHRPYRPSLGLEASLDEITKNRGILYDPAVVDACLQLFGQRDYQMPD